MSVCLFYVYVAEWFRSSSKIVDYVFFGMSVKSSAFFLSLFILFRFLSSNVCYLCFFDISV